MITELVSLDPPRVAAFLTACLGVEVPSFDVARVADSDLSDRNPTENHADSVLVLEDADGNDLYALIFEIQRRPDDDKTYSWLVYLAMTRRRHRCPAMVVVIATNNATARFASRPIDTGQPGYPFKPVVWGPDDVPRIEEPAQAAGDPCIASLAVIIHQDEPDQLHAFAETINHLQAPEARFYAGLALRALTEDRRQLLEGIMANERYDYWAELAEEKIQEGRVEGRVEGRHEGSLVTAVQAVLTVLTARGLAVPASVSDRIQRCTDRNQLATWLQRAVTVKKADDLFA